MYSLFARLMLLIEVASIISQAFSTRFSNCGLLSSFSYCNISVRKFLFALDHTVSILLNGLLWGGWNTGINSSFSSFIVATVLWLEWLSRTSTCFWWLYLIRTDIFTLRKKTLNCFCSVDVPSIYTGCSRQSPMPPYTVVRWHWLLR